MILDVLLGLVLVGAFYNGYSKGIIYSLLSFVAIVLGFIIAMNFSTLASVWLYKNFNVPSVLMPALSFILVLISVIAAIKLVAYITEKILRAIMLNFVNKILGGLVWSVTAAMLFGMLVFFLDGTGILADNLKYSSTTYNYIMPLGPKGLSMFNALIPYFKESFELLNKTVQDAASSN